MDSIGKIVSEDDYVYFKIIKDYELDKSEYKTYKFNKEAVLVEEYTTSDRDGIYRNGEYIIYYPNGNKKKSTLFEDNRLVGKELIWYENGNQMMENEYTFDLDSKKTITRTFKFWNKENIQTVIDGNGSSEQINENFTEKGAYLNGLKNGEWTGKSTATSYSYNEKYDNGLLIEGELTDDKGEKYFYKELEKLPMPKKGFNDFYKFIGNNFNYSKEADKLNIKGKIILGFIVDIDGKITEPKIIKSVGYGLDEEAIRVITKYDSWIPGIQRGRKVRCSYQIPIVLSGTY